MLTDKIELIRDGKLQVLLTWHKTDDGGGFIPIAIEFSDAVDVETTFPRSTEGPAALGIPSPDILIR